ncbi:MAG: cupin domain-containing protein [Vicinamibacterales bacterium]
MKVPVHRLALLLTPVLLFVGPSVWGSQPQQTPPAAPAGTTFTGNVTRPESKDLTIGRVQFEAAARTYWHSHPNGQLILVEKGRGRAQKQGEAMKELATGDALYTAPNVLHWHGAAPGQSMTQVTVGFGGMTQWKQEVTEAEYSGKGTH